MLKLLKIPVAVEKVKEEKVAVVAEEETIFKIKTPVVEESLREEKILTVKEGVENRISKARSIEEKEKNNSLGVIFESF